MTERDIDAIASYDTPDGYIARRSGPRERPGICPCCGSDVDHPSAFDPTCGTHECRAAWVTRPRGTAR